MALFPLSKLPKSKVREIAEENNLIVANKKDSTGICFIGERDFTKFLQNYIPAQPGDVVNIITKETIGKHIGAMYYTIGQRKGLYLGGQEEPFYVAGHDLSKRIIYVAPSSDKSYLMSDEAIINDVNWLIDEKLEGKQLDVKFRYKSTSVKCSIEWIDENTLKVIYPKGFEAVTPGQQAVFYNGDYCVGGGTISDIYSKGKIKAFL